MDNEINPKRKGGAEKERDRKKKKLYGSAAKCRNVMDMFKMSNTQTTSSTGDTELVAGPSAAEAEFIDVEILILRKNSISLPALQMC